MTASTTIVGGRWERLALDHLVARGLERITANFRCRWGEIDLVMLEKDCLVFVEVRYRRANKFANAAASVDGHKQRKLIRSATSFLARHPEYCNFAMRFDVVAIDAASDEQVRLQWLRDAFRPEA